MIRPRVVLLLGSLAACSPALPVEQPNRALVRDLQRIVDVRAGVGWFVDESEMVAALPYAMKTVCQVPEEARQRSLHWLDERIGALGGPDLKAVWIKRDRDIEMMSELVLMARTRLLLARAEAWAREGRCPFWLEPHDNFYGVNTLAGRLILTFEGGGRLISELALGQVHVGGGGSGRILAGYGFGETWVLSLGLEGGGSARFTDLRLGEQRVLPQLVGQVTAPVVLRWQFGLTAHTEIEAGPMAYVGEAVADPNTRAVEVQFDWGLHGAVAFGGSYLRIHPGVIPKFAVVGTVDYVPAVGLRAGLLQVGVGVRTGIDISSWKKF